MRFVITTEMKFHPIVFVILLNFAYFSFGMELVHARTIEELTDQLKDPNKEVRENTVKELGEIRDERAVKWLISALDEEVKKAKKAERGILGD